MNLADHDFNGAVGHIVQETAVMGDEKNGALICLEIFLEPLDRLYVEVIGRLVKKQHIRFGKKNLGKFDAHIPSLAECFRVSA